MKDYKHNVSCALKRDKLSRTIISLLFIYKNAMVTVYFALLKSSILLSLLLYYVKITILKFFLFESYVKVLYKKEVIFSWLLIGTSECHCFRTFIVIYKMLILIIQLKMMNCFPH